MSMTAAFALHLHGDYHLVCVGCFYWEICWTAAIEWRLDGGSNVMIWLGAAIMKWRFGSVKERGGDSERELREEVNGVLKERFWEQHSRKFCRRELSCVSDLPLRLTDG